MNLRTQVMRGGVYLVLRQGLGAVISAVGVIVLTRILGPGAYGTYAAAFGIYVYLFMLSQWGLEVYLIRREEEVHPQEYHQAFTLLLLLGLAGAASGFLALPLIERWVRLEGFEPVAMALLAGIPVQLVGLVPQARLERALDFRRIAMIELSVQVVFYLVALPLAYQGLGPWAPVGGWWAQELLRLGLLYRMSAYRPRLYWESARARAMVGYGLGYSSSIWIWHLRILVNPLVVGRYLGADAVGYVALTIRMVEQLGFVRMAAWRLSIVALARLQDDLARMARAVSEGMSFQIISLGPLLLAFGLVAPWIIPLLFGSSWLPVLEIYPFIALGYLSSAMSNLHASALYVLQRNLEVTIFHLLHVVLFSGSALLLVSHLGLRGYGWAEVAALPSYLLLHIWFASYIGRPAYARAGIWFTACAIPLFAWQLGPWTWISVSVPLVLPATRKELLRAAATVFEVMLRKGTPGH